MNKQLSTFHTGASLSSRIPVWICLLAGILLTALTAFRWNIAALGWICTVPFLIAATRLQGWKGNLQLLAALVLAYTLQTMKVISSPLPASMALMFSIPAALTCFLILLIWRRIYLRCGRIWALYSFVALSTLSDWFSLTYSFAGDWGTSGNFLIDNLVLLQLCSLGGLPLLGALVALVAAHVFILIDAPSPREYWPHQVAACAIILILMAWAALRLDHLEMKPTLHVAGITTRLGLTDGMPDTASLQKNTDTLFMRTEIAAERGAQVVVWNEAATLITPDQESAFRQRASTVARHRGIDFVIAYGVILQTSPLLLDNKYEWFAPDGSSLEVYRKHYPVPGEPSLKGDAPIKVLQRPWGRAAGAICYDYDFLHIARQHAEENAGLILLPASDWRGIDPYHTLMARVRAIEGGMSVVRPVRDSTSMAFDAYGRIRASLNAQEANDGILFATVPTQHVSTVYTSYGDWPVALAAAFLVAALAYSLKNSQRNMPEESNTAPR
jgi:apolipoprotein N-acyltransferase